MFKGFKEFLSRGNIVDLAVAVVIGTAFTALVTKFTDSIIAPLINRVGVNQQSSVGILRISIGGAQTVLLTEIRDLLAQTNGDSSGKHGGPTTTPPPAHGPRADAESQ